MRTGAVDVRSWRGARIEVTPAGRRALVLDSITRFTPGVVPVDPAELREPFPQLSLSVTPCVRICHDGTLAPYTALINFPWQRDATGEP